MPRPSTSAAGALDAVYGGLTSSAPTSEARCASSDDWGRCLRRKNQMRAPIIATAATPPTTPPAMAPTGVGDPGESPPSEFPWLSPPFSFSFPVPWDSPESSGSSVAKRALASGDDHSTVSRPLIMQTVSMPVLSWHGTCVSYPSSYHDRMALLVS